MSGCLGIFEKCSDEELLDLYREDDIFFNTGVCGEGKLREILDKYLEFSRPRGIVLMEAHLLREIANRWEKAAENELEKPLLKHPILRGEDVWYANTECRSIDHGLVELSIYEDGTLVDISVMFDDADFEDFYGSAYGTCLFSRREDAERAILKG